MIPMVEVLQTSQTRDTLSGTDGKWNSEHDEKYRVFLLEDNEGNAMVFEGFLEALCEPELVVATTLAELESFTEDIAEGAFDLVVFDIMLPDGESTEHLRALSQASPTPFCAYTAKASPVDCERFIEAGARQVFTKPLVYNDFVQKIAPLIEGTH